jgi:ATP-dependent Clp protease adaptor protein ClpS
MTQAEPELLEETKLQPPYNVILLDDQDHSYDYVIEMLQKVLGHSVERAFQMARKVDLEGRVIVYTGSFEQAEFKQQQIHGFGKDWRIPACAGSMTAVLEPGPVT